MFRTVTEGIRQAVGKAEAVIILEGAKKSPEIARGGLHLLQAGVAVSIRGARHLPNSFQSAAHHASEVAELARVRMKLTNEQSGRYTDSSAFAGDGSQVLIDHKFAA